MDDAGELVFAAAISAQGARGRHARTGKPAV